MQMFEHLPPSPLPGSCTASCLHTPLISNRESQTGMMTPTRRRRPLRGGGTWCAYFNSMKCEDALSAGVETNRAMSSTTPSTAPPLAARPHTALTHLVASHPSPICHTPPELFNCAHSTRVCGFHTCQLRSLALAERAPLRDAGLFHRANGFLRLRLAHSLIHSLTYSLTHPLVLTYSLTHSLTHSHTLSLTAS